MVASKILLDLYRTMRRIRMFEEKLVVLYAQGFIPGHVHLYVGEEPIAAGVCAHLRVSDFVFSSHRPHGHLIAKGARLDKMLAEVFGKAGGYNHGKGGHMHIAAPDVRVIANGIVGGWFGAAAGTALAQKRQQNSEVTVVFFGDGAANLGALYEVLNLASRWSLPLILVCENNRFAISTPSEVVAGGPGFAARAAAFGIESMAVDGYDTLAVYEAGRTAVARAREGRGPTFLECHTYRLRGHREGDPQSYRSREEVAEWRKKDPVKAFGRLLLERGVLKPEEEEAIRLDIEHEIEAAVHYAKEAPYPALDTGLADVYAPAPAGGAQA
jgi:TPP-dependent pyruvate/acetoin dehydrogenase alpha subunit